MEASKNLTVDYPTAVRTHKNSKHNCCRNDYERFLNLAWAPEICSYCNNLKCGLNTEIPKKNFRKVFTNMTIFHKLQAEIWLDSFSSLVNLSVVILNITLLLSCKRWHEYEILKIIYTTFFQQHQNFQQATRKFAQPIHRNMPGIIFPAF